MGTPRSVAIYARISSDQDGTQLGVTRQLKDCRKEAERLGWAVGAEYVDNDISAYSGKKRPAWSEMLADIADGLRDGVIAYHQDRLSRRPSEIEAFLETVAQAGVTQVRFVASGDVDLVNGDGLLMMRVMGAVAASESDTKSRRVRRKMLELAERGEPSGGSRPYGYEDDRRTIRQSEASVIRDLVERHLAGESLRSLTTWLNEQGIASARGGTWNSSVLRKLLLSPRIAGLRQHQGEVIGPGTWDPIITPAQRDGILALAEQRTVTGRRSPRRYPLSGLLRCGRCDRTLFGATRNGTRRYECMSGPDHGGCGRLAVVAPSVEELITEAVLYRLDTPDLADALAGRAAADEHSAALADELASDRKQLDELSGLWADKEISAREWMQARSRIEARIKKAERQIARTTRSTALADWIGNSEQLRAQWAGLTLTRQHAIIAAVLDHAIVGPGQPGRPFDPKRVRPIWRL